MKIHPLFGEEAEFHGAATHRITVDYTDLQALAGGTGAQNLTPLTVKAGGLLRLIYARLTAPFTSSDGTLLSIAATLGDAGSANRYMTSYELLTPTPAPVQPGVLLSPLLYINTVDTAVLLGLTPTANKNLNTATAGEISFYAHLIPGNPPA